MARLAQLVERKALNLVVVGSSPTVGTLFPGRVFSDTPHSTLLHKSGTKQDTRLQVWQSDGGHA